MHHEFVELFNRELKVLKEHAREFAAEYPGIAERLGGLVDERQDPMVTGLLEGAAYLAARVQLKLKHEFPEFTNNLLEQLVPNYLAPTPSALLAKLVPSFADPALREGRRVPRGAYLDATYVERERRVASRYKLATAVTLWPFDIIGAEYFASPGPLQALGVPTEPAVVSGMRLSLTYRMANSIELEISDVEALKQPGFTFAGCRTTELPIFLLGSEADAIGVYEQLFGHRVSVYFRYLDEFGDAVVLRAPQECIEQVGFSEDEALFPADRRVFSGFHLLREFFAFPQKFLGFKITRLSEIMPRLPAKSVDVLFCFDEINTRLSAAVRPQIFALYAGPALNLFEKTTDRIVVKSNQHEYHLVPDRSRYLDFEAHRVLQVYAHYAGGRDRVPVHPLYSAPEGASPESSLYYTIRRMPRRRTVEERKYGVASDYVGTDVFISLVEPSGLGEEPAVAELSVRALCSNRHLPEHLPVGEGGADFRLVDDVTLNVLCVAGPTPPREPVLSQMQAGGQGTFSGAIAWRLINMLSVNQLGLVQRGSGRHGQAVREILSLFADLRDSATDRKIRGIRDVDSRPIVRRFRQRGGIGAARGIEITLTLDDKAFEGSGAFLLGAVLDRFFSEYVALNYFTQTVVRTAERGQIMRWPTRPGVREPL